MPSDDLIIQHPRFPDIQVVAEYVDNTGFFDNALCAQVGSNIWYFPDEEDPMARAPWMEWDGENIGDLINDTYDALAKICRECPVLSECFNYGIHHEEWGFWGGTSRNQRIRLRHANKIRLHEPYDSDALDEQITENRKVLDERDEWEYYGSSQ